MSAYNFNTMAKLLRIQQKVEKLTRKIEEEREKKKEREEQEQDKTNKINTSS